MAKWVDLTLVRGDSIPTLRFPFVDENDDAIDLTGYTATFTIKKYIDDRTDDENNVFQEIQDPIPLPAAGIVNFNISGEDVNTFVDKYYWDMQIVDPASGYILTSFLGTMNFIRDVTRSV